MYSWDWFGRLWDLLPTGFGYIPESFLHSSLPYLRNIHGTRNSCFHTYTSNLQLYNPIEDQARFCSWASLRTMLYSCKVEYLFKHECDPGMPLPRWFLLSFLCTAFLWFRQFPCTLPYISLSYDISVQIPHGICTGNWGVRRVFYFIFTCLIFPYSFVMRLPNHLDCSTEDFYLL